MVGFVADRLTLREEMVLSSAFQRLRQEVSGDLRHYAVRYCKTSDELYRRDIAEKYIRRADAILQYIAYWQARSFSFLGVTADDLMQWARLAALEALQRYDISRDTDYSTYLVSYVKRYVYNKVLDELPVPRDVSKRIRKLLREGWAPSELPEPLRNAFHLRSPLTVDSCTMEQFGFRDDEPEDDQLGDVVSVLGVSLWNEIRDAVQDLRECNQLEHLVVEVIRRERDCPAELLPYLLNLKRYLISLLQQNRADHRRCFC